MAVREYFWGAELTENKKTVVWDPESEDKDLDNDSSGITHFLFLKQATLGLKAKDGERNMVEVEAEDFDGNSIKLPLFSLKMGLNESTVLDIGAQPPLTLRLVSGSGPVHISGQHALELNEDDMDMLEDEVEEAEESPLKGPSRLQAKKRPASSTDGPAKKAKLNESDAKKKTSATKNDEDSDSSDDEDFNPDLGGDSDDEGGESDEEDESDMEEGTPDKTQKKGKVEAEPKSLDKIKQELKKIYKTRLESVVVGHKKLLTDKKDLENTVDNLKKQIDQGKEECQEIMTENKKLSNSIQALEKKTVDLTTQAIELTTCKMQEESTKVRLENRRLNAKMPILEKQIDELMEEIPELRKKNRSLTTENKELNETLKRENSMRDELFKQKTDMAEEIADLKQQMESYVEMKEVAENKVVDLMRDVELLKRATAGSEEVVVKRHSGIYYREDGESADEEVGKVSPHLT